MHIAEGVLSAPVLVTGAVLACAGTAIGLRRMDYDRLMAVGMLTSAFFVASLIHVPVGVSSAHLLGTGLLGVMLGWAAFPAIVVALALQALFFQYGGLTVLGVNACTMGFAAVLAHVVYRLTLGWSRSVAAFACGALGVALAALFTALALACTDEGFTAAAVALLVAHLPVMLAEGCITMFTVGFMARVRPEVLAVLALCLVAGLAPTAALAHRVNIFAWVEGDSVHVQAGFSRKSPARQSVVTVFRGSPADANDVLITGATDDTGLFTFAIPAEAREHGLTIRVNAGQGHQNDWTMDAKEFAAATNAKQATQDTPAVNVTPEAPTAQPNRPDHATQKGKTASGNNGRAQPDQHGQPYMADDGPRLRDIIGGLGWIVGLTGMGMAWRARRKSA